MRANASSFEGINSRRGAASGARVRGEFWYVFTLNEGRVTRLDIYLSREQALEAVGLSE